MAKLELKEINIALELYVALRRAGLKDSMIDLIMQNDEYAESLVALIGLPVEAREPYPFADLPIDKLGLGKPLTSKLEWEGVGSIGVLALCSAQDLRSMRGIAKLSIDAIVHRLKASNLSLRQFDEDMRVKALQLYPDAYTMPAYVMLRNIGIKTDAARKLCDDYIQITIGELIEHGKHEFQARLTTVSPHNALEVTRQIKAAEQFLDDLNLQFNT